MKKCFVTAALIASLVFSAQSASAGEPNLGSLGLSSMTKMNHVQSMAIRGQTRRSTNTVTVTGQTFDAKVGGIIIIGGGPIGGGFIGGAAGVGSLSTATSGYSATGTSSASGWASSQARLVGGSFATSSAVAQ
jgi:hypothetical protein